MHGAFPLRTCSALTVLAVPLEQRSGPNHFRTALARYSFAAALNQFGQVARATVECSRAVPILSKLLTDEHPEIPRFINAQAILAKGNGDYLEARRLQELELSLIQRRTPPDSIAMARYIGLATEIRNDLGDYATALPMAEQMCALFTRSTLVAIPISPRHTSSWRGPMSVWATSQGALHGSTV